MHIKLSVLLASFGFFSVGARAQESGPEGFEVAYRATISDSDSMMLAIGSPLLGNFWRFGIEVGKRFYQDFSDDGAKYAAASGTDFGAFYSSTTPITAQLSLPVTLHLDYNTYRKQKLSGEGTESAGHLAMELDAAIRVRNNASASFFADVGWLYRLSFLPEKRVVIGSSTLRGSEPGVLLRIGYTF